MKDEILKYYIPKSFVKQEMRYHFLIGFILGMGASIVIGVLCWLVFFIL